MLVSIDFQVSTLVAWTSFSVEIGMVELEIVQNVIEKIGFDFDMAIFYFELAMQVDQEDTKVEYSFCIISIEIWREDENKAYLFEKVEQILFLFG